MNVHDWLSNLELPWNSKKFDAVEVQFKGNRKEFYRNPLGIDLYNNDWVTVDAHYGYELGRISLKGELVRLQMKRKKVKEEDSGLRKVLRKATDEERVKLTDLRAREESVLVRAREIIAFSTLPMKLSDVEYQADGSKIYFYYTAESRIDFRDLIRRLSDAFRCRVEMRQIGPRQETARLGGLGVCGRELCCSSWLTDFKAVGSTAARYQNLAHNSAKLTGQCGRLKCCLNYELEVYMDALKGFPKNNRFIETRSGTYELVKTDIFRKLLWYQPKVKSGEFSDDNLVSLSLDTVVALLDDLKKGIKAETLQSLSVTMVSLEGEGEEEPDYEQDSEGLVDRFDRSGRRNKRKKNRPASARHGHSSGAPQSGATKSGATASPASTSAPSAPPSPQNFRPAPAAGGTPSQQLGSPSGGTDARRDGGNSRNRQRDRDRRQHRGNRDDRNHRSGGSGNSGPNPAGGNS